MRDQANSLLVEMRGVIPHLTLGELIVIHQEIDWALNSLLNVAPILDTLDLRSSNIRKEIITSE